MRLPLGQSNTTASPRACSCSSAVRAASGSSNCQLLSPAIGESPASAGQLLSRSRAALRSLLRLRVQRTARPLSSVSSVALPSPGRSCGPASPNGCTNSSRLRPDSWPWPIGVRCRCGRASAATFSAASLSPPPMSECTVSIGATAASPCSSCFSAPLGTLSPALPRMTPISRWPASNWINRIRWGVSRTGNTVCPSCGKGSMLTRMSLLRLATVSVGPARTSSTGSSALASPNSNGCPTAASRARSVSRR